MERQAVKPQKEIKIEKWQIQSTDADNLPRLHLAILTAKPQKLQIQRYCIKCKF